MTGRFLAATLGIAVTFGLAGGALAQKWASAPKDQTTPPAAAEATTTDQDVDQNKPASPADQDAEKKMPDEVKLETATFGGGCFWCLEAVFERIPGVKSVVSGYAGGSVPNPSYEMVCTGQTGHAEVVQIGYDPKVVSFEKLLNVFWHSHDPTTLFRQGPDVGTQYRSIILYQNEDQKRAAQKSYYQLTAAGAFDSPIVTQLVALDKFYPAERYHQDYYRKHPNAEYCQIYIAPKVQKIKKALQKQKAKASSKPRRR